MFQLRCAATAALFFVCAFAHASDEQALSAPFAPQQPVEIMINQQELAVDVPDSAAIGAQFGLLGALVSAAVDNAKAGYAEKRVVEMRNQLVDFRFNERFETAVRDKIIAAQLTADPVVSVRLGAWTGPEAKAAGAAPKQGVIVLSPRYAIANNFENMRISLDVRYVDRELKSNGKLKEKFRFGRSYTFSYPLDKVSGSGADGDAARWVAFGKPQLQWLMAEGIDQVTDMFVYDMTDVGVDESLVKIDGFATVAGKSVAGRQVRSGDGWVWTRAKRTRAITGVRPVGESRPIVMTATPAAAPTASSDSATPSTPAAAAAAPVVADIAAPSAVAVPAQTPAAAPSAPAAPSAEPATSTPAATTPAADAG